MTPPSLLPGALDGVRVLDFTTVMSGPFATRLLADLGADVVKVESFEGDQVRARPPLRDGHSSYFAQLNAGKRSIVLDLKSPEAHALIVKLVQSFDVVVENFRPGVMTRLGLDYDTLSAANPRLICCAVSGYGQQGPRAQDPAYAPVIHAASGFDHIMRRYQGPEARPPVNGVFIADVLAGVYATTAINAALYQRQHTGKGQHIDLSMLEAMLGMLVFEVQAAQFPGNNDRPLHEPLRTRDGFIMIAPISPRNFEQLCKATGHEEWLTDERFRTTPARNANWKALLGELETWTSTRTAAEVDTLMKAQGVPCSPYQSVEAVLQDPQILFREALKSLHDGAGSFKVPNPPFRMSGSLAEAREGIAGLGEHGPDILREDLGLSEADIARLIRKGVVGAP